MWTSASPYREAIEVDDNAFALFNMGNSYNLGRVVGKSMARRCRLNR